MKATFWLLTAVIAMGLVSKTEAIELEGIDFGGWLAAGIYDNSHGLEASGNAPLGFNNLAEEYQVHQLWVYAEHAADNGGHGVDVGFRADFLWGTDGPDTVAFGDGGWDTSWQTSNQYGFAMPQLYAEVAVGDWTWKAGHFYTIIGYEVVQAPDNFFYSHAYTMYYNEPFTHTGFLGERSLGEFVTLYAGWTAGWDSGFGNVNDGSTFLGGVGLQLTDNTFLMWATTFGDPGDQPPVGNAIVTTDVYMNSIVLSSSFGNGWNYIFHHDYQYRQSDLVPGTNFKQYGINQYLTKDITDKLAAGVRYEWFYAGKNSGLSNPAGAAVPFGQHYQALTCGLNFRPKDHIIVKPEMRYDYTDSDQGFASFAKGTKRSQFSWGIQTIMTY